MVRSSADMAPPSHRRFACARRAARSGSTLLTALCTVVILALVAANVLSSLSARYGSAYRSAAWNEALTAADTGIDSTLAEVARQIPDVRGTNVSGLTTGFSQQALPATDLLEFDAAGLLAKGTLLTIHPDPFTRLGEAGTTQRSSVGLSVLNLSDLLDGGVKGLLGTAPGILNGRDLQLIRLVSTGTVALSGPQTAGPNRLDNELWRPSLLTDRLTGKAITQAVVSRQVEVILRPVRPYEAALVSDDAVLAPGTGTVFDSFNSASPLASTNGQYDSTKRLAHGSIRANGSSVNVGGNVYGDLSTNGGGATASSRVSGRVSNTGYTPLPLVNPPTWTGSQTPTTVTGTTTVAAGLLTPQRYKFNGVSGTLKVNRGFLGVGTAVEIFVDGDLTGGLEIDPLVAAKVYVSGSINTKASRLKNGAAQAGNLQIYGVYKEATAAPFIRLDTDAPLVAAIYAPGHKIYLDGGGDFSGALVGARFEAGGPVQIHYDEALACNAGPLLRFEVASWREITDD